jgi:hypothetical protein
MSLHNLIKFLYHKNNYVPKIIHFHFSTLYISHHIKKIFCLYFSTKNVAVRMSFRKFLFPSFPKLVFLLLSAVQPTSIVTFPSRHNFLLTGLCTTFLSFAVQSTLASVFIMVNKYLLKYADRTNKNFECLIKLVC